MRGPRFGASSCPSPGNDRPCLCGRTVRARLQPTAAGTAVDDLPLRISRALSFRLRDVDNACARAKQGGTLTIAQGGWRTRRLYWSLQLGPSGSILSLMELALAVATRLAELPLAGLWPRCLRSADYRFTVNAFDLLAPAEVTTFTLTLPKSVLAGTLHLMRVALQERYLAHFAAPNFT